MWLRVASEDVCVFTQNGYFITIFLHKLNIISDEPNQNVQ